MDDRRSERFGRYEILAELGRGAMGVVYKARDPKINRWVAVKTISLAGQPPEDEKEYRERFHREAEAAGRLSHPGIVTIFDVGEEPETRAPYIVMEFVGGQSLDKLLSGEDRKLPLETALQLAHELAEALDCAHGQGVVHRDLKPANILLTEEGHAKIADFGVAKLNLANHTLAGRALGTPAYMSPEQLNDEAVDGRSDLFSLGVVLYTILTGYRPFQGNSALTVSYKVVNRDPIPATVLETELPQGLDYIISRAMAKDPAQRYQRGMEMALDIQDLREGRELWSKAKQPGSTPPGMPTVLGEKDRQSATARIGTVVKPRSSKRVQSPQNWAAEKLMANMRKKSLVGVVFLMGLLLFGLRLGHVASPTAAPARSDLEKTIAPPSQFGEVMVGKSAAVPPAAVPSATAPSRDTSTPQALQSIAPKPRKALMIPPAAKAGLVATSSAAVPAVTMPATLDIEVDHKFAEAHLSVWVDDQLSYTHTLEGTDKKHLVVFHHVQGHEIHSMQIQPGNHLLRVQVISESRSSSQSVTGAFASGAEKLLRIYFDKRAEMNLKLE
ncbi:MAG TPA: serine/threonine-protein kinase [Candidatus Polarisedimenticolia bacterium]|nr:serine/threonine-protein kinase [Candidatus Polarisedimenticolia bacterium]